MIPDERYLSIIASFLSGLHPADHGPWNLLGIVVGVDRCRLAGLGLGPALSLSCDLDLVSDGEGEGEQFPLAAPSDLGVMRGEEGGLELESGDRFISVIRIDTNG